FGMVFVAGMVQVSMLVLGLATLLHTYPLALDVLRWVGAAYLVWLGIKMLKVSRQPVDAVLKPRTMTGRQAVKEGAINSLTNPKSLLFMFAFLPQFVNPEIGPVWVQLLVLGSIQKLAGILSLGSVAMAAGTVGQWLARNPRWLVWQQRFTGVVMMGLGAKLLLGGGAASAPR
ncbi:LysE family translocator, partial [Microbacterium arabinogalactanolyticum]